MMQSLATCKEAWIEFVKRAKEVYRKHNIIIFLIAIQKQVMAVPALLACSATHQSLVKSGIRTNTGLVIDTGSAREVHHFALLAGYGAEAVCPWLTYETIKTLTDDFSGRSREIY